MKKGGVVLPIGMTVVCDSKHLGSVQRISPNGASFIYLGNITATGVTFLVSTSIYKCFSSADAPDRSHCLAPHVKTKILELMECGIHKKAEILQRLKVAQVL